MPNLRLNIAANYASFAYATAISMVFMPLLHQALEPEFFGLIGIFILLTNLLALLDLGLVSTVSRECAVHRNSPTSVGTLPHIIRATGLFLHAIGGILIAALIALPDSITFQWLSIDQISSESARDCLHLIFLATIIRWVSGLYRGVINGFERQITTSVINVLSATLRFPVAYAVILKSDNPAINYFQLQLTIALIEYVLLYLTTKKSTLHIKPASFELADFSKLFYHIIRLAASISVLTFVTTLYTQIDKVILMKLLPLAQFGDFSLVQAATTGIAALGGPIATALIPRFTNLTANGNSKQLFNEYIRSQKILLTLMLPCGISCIFLAPQILFAWTGNIQFSLELGTIFGIYAMGNVIWLISTIPCHLKYARGEMSFLLRYNLVLVLVYVPSAIFMGLKFGPIGTGLAWLSVNVVAFLFSHTIILRKFFSIHSRISIYQEVAMASAIAAMVVFLTYVALPETVSRFTAALQSIACFAVAAATVYFALSACGKQESLRKISGKH